MAEKLLKVDYTNQNIAEKAQELNERRNSRFLCDFCSPCYKWIIRKLYAKHLFLPPKEADQINSFQYAHFEIPLYRHPLVSLLTIFLPLWFLGFLNLGIYFQEYSLADRIASIATVMIAYVSM